MAFDLNPQSPEAVKSPEMIQTPEANREAGVDISQSVQDAPRYQSAPEAAPQPTVAVPDVRQETVQYAPSPLYAQVEGALADEQIGALYKELPEGKKAAFKIAGEKLAAEITDAIARRKFKPHRALAGTRKWLGMIDAKFPYLLQKAKIELDTLSHIDEAVAKGEISNM